MPRSSGRRPLQLTVSPLGRSTASSWHPDRPAAAADLGITVATARKRLQAVFGKTGVGRQSELVRLLAGSVLELREDPD